MRIGRVRPATAGAIVVGLLGIGAYGVRSATAHSPDGRLLQFENETGAERSISSAAIDENHPFFQSLGTNGRSCVTCHDPRAGWSLAPSLVRSRFDVDGGLADALFRPVDGATCPGADLTSEDRRRTAYALLLDRGVIRIGRTLPPGAEFEIVERDDPYGCPTGSEVSVYRRPLSAANLAVATEIMWDGREDDLGTQAQNAHRIHAEATAPLSARQLRRIVTFEMGLFAAQMTDRAAGNLNEAGAAGGPRALSDQEFFEGINDPVPGRNPTGAAFNPRAITLFTAWSRLPGRPNAIRLARASIARGQELFNTLPMTIGDIPGFTEEFPDAGISGFGRATCSTCHNTPNVGNRSRFGPMNIGTADRSRRSRELPLFTLRHKVTGQVTWSSDPGRALVTGRWSDIGRFKTPALRALASRPPYFHDGSAATLSDVLTFYELRFGFRLTAEQRADLLAFLTAL